MKIIKRLFEIIGGDAGYLHIARSRNDQVITDFKLWLKKSSNEIKYFVQHYEKITKWMMKDLNKKAQIVIKFEKNHKISSINFN